MRRIIDGSEKTNVRPRWWLIAKNGNAGWEFLTPDGDGEETLAVFGHEEEAKMFLHLGGYSDDSWRVRESSTGEIVSMLYGPCSDVESASWDGSWDLLSEFSLTLDPGSPLSEKTNPLGSSAKRTGVLRRTPVLQD